MPSSLLDQDGPILLLDSCSSAFLTPPSADPHLHAFPIAWPRRTGILRFSSLLGQDRPVASRFPQFLAKKDLYRDVCTTDKPRQNRRTRRSRQTTVADANEPVAAAGPPWRTQTNRSPLDGFTLHE
ncbi:hypothetical protein Y032_0005g2714 [Ancylostoma ceylanicum]|uniref:Uncharacterized protein n=1 Tax=Ancylostoma ceylanicum TaxID=53326 RepID=A0A016VU75_9BILA|nr:hypothetical protein Y032_0005g2714 [Ancylostoma ceylanicum]